MVIIAQPGVDITRTKDGRTPRHSQGGDKPTPVPCTKRDGTVRARQAVVKMRLPKSSC